MSPSACAACAAGADDWVTKPCHPEEVLARVEAVIRRRKRSSDRSDVGPLVAGELEIRADQFQAFVGGRSIDLTRREFELLELLAQAQGKVLQREEIYQAVWGYAMAHGDRSVDVFVRKLRQKLETASPDWSYIHTHFGVGYRFQPERPGGPDEAAAFEASLGQQSAAPAPAPTPLEESPPDPEVSEGRARAVVGNAFRDRRLLTSAATPATRPRPPRASATITSQTGAPSSSSSSSVVSAGVAVAVSVGWVSVTCGAGSSTSGGPIQRTTSPSS